MGEPLIPCWFAGGSVPEYRECVTFGYPHETTNGERMNNQYFRTRDEAWDYILRNIEAWEGFAARDVESARAALLKALEKAAAALAARVAYTEAREKEVPRG